MDNNNLYSLCFSYDKKEMAINKNDIEKSSVDLRVFNNNNEKDYESDKGNIRSFQNGGETIILIFFKESEDPFYQEHIDFHTNDVVGNY